MVTLVTGSTGLLGNNVVRHLLASGRRVRVLVRENSDPRPLAGLDLEIIKGDVRHREAVRQAAGGVNAIVHAAAYVQIGWTGMDVARAVNVDGTRHVAQAASAEGVPLIHVSSIEALATSGVGEPLSEDQATATGGVLCPYVLTKREAEAVVLDEVNNGLHAVIVNPGYMIGPYDWKPSSGRMLLDVARGWGLFAPLGSNNYCDVRDVAAGILAALERGRAGTRYILAGQSLSYFQAWRIFADVTGATPPVFPAVSLLRGAAGRVGDLLTKLTGHEPDLNSAATALSAQRRNFSSALAERELGCRFRPLREAAADAWAWFRQNGYV